MTASISRRPRPRPTIRDVAGVAGVSKSTVSNVIRDATCVAPETRERVLEAIAAVGYRPNAVARHLVRMQTSTVGILVGDLSNLFYSELAKLVEQRLSASGFATMICNTDGRRASEENRVAMLLEHRVAGILMLQFSGDPATLRELREEGVPVVIVSCWEDEADCVAVDEEAGASLAVSHLLELGHRRIAYVSSDLVEPNTDAARFAGYRTALAKAGVAPATELVQRVDRPAYLRGDADMRARVRQSMSFADPPTAFFASNDLVAIDLIETIEELGLRVPDDVSVVGFDDIAMAGLARVSLTTVSQPRGELARLAAGIVIGRIEGRADPDPGLRQLRLAPTLVVRRSTAPPQGVPS